MVGTRFQVEIDKVMGNRFQIEFEKSERDFVLSLTKWWVTAFKLSLTKRRVTVFKMNSKMSLKNDEFERCLS